MVSNTEGAAISVVTCELFTDATLGLLDKLVSDKRATTLVLVGDLFSNVTTPVLSSEPADLSLDLEFS